MADVTQPHNVAANGTATPATATLASVSTGSLLICIIAAIGTNPTIATPTGDSWVQIQKTNGASVSFAMYMLANAASGSHVPSAVLGGTVTGWLLCCYEFTATGANAGLQGSAKLTSAVAQLTNIFPTAGNTLSNELFVYAIARATATITAQNSVNSPLCNWSASVLPQAGVQGLSMDFYWVSTFGQGVGQYPIASGLLSGAVASVAIGAYFNTIASNSQVGDNVSGGAGIYVPQFYSGMIGG